MPPAPLRQIGSLLLVFAFLLRIRLRRWFWLTLPEEQLLYFFKHSDPLHSFPAAPPGRLFFCDILVPGFVFWLHGGVCYAFRLNIGRYNSLRSGRRILVLYVFFHIPPGRFSAAGGASLCLYVPRLFLFDDVPRRDCR